MMDTKIDKLKDQTNMAATGCNMKDITPAEWFVINNLLKISSANEAAELKNIY